MARTVERASIADVARRSGVSISTASRVVSNNGYPVAAVTRRRVLEAVRELNYSPSALAKALVTKRTQIVGVIVGDVEDPYFAEIVRGVEDVARRAGYLVIVCNADRDPATELRYLRTLLGYRVDGVILAGGGVIDEDYDDQLIQAVARLEQQGTVVIALAKVLAPVPCITIDNHAAAAAMAGHLLDLGHRRIGVIAGPPNVTTAQIRLAGVREALGPRRLPATMVVDGEFTVSGGERAAACLLDRATPPTALFALNDQMAIGALTAAHRRGFEIPKDLTIVGFGNTIAARQAWPPLTTVLVPRHEMGATAMEALLEQRDGGRPVASHLLETRPIVRASCGPPRARHKDGTA